MSDPAIPGPGFTCCDARPALRDPVHIHPGAVINGEEVVFVGKPKVQKYVCDHGLFLRAVVVIGWRCWDGVIRRGRFCQQINDRFAPGQTDDYVATPITNPLRWPRKPDA